MTLKNQNTNSKMQRMTKQRRIILDEIGKPGQHLTADMVYDLVKQKLPNISLATVYRNLETLAEQKLVRRLTVGGGQRHYDGGAHLHYHVKCTICGKISDVSAEPFGDLNQTAELGCDGFEIFDHELEFQGTCEDCKQDLEDPSVD